MILLLSTYDLGRQPFGLASPAAWLRRAGVEVALRDLSRDPLTQDDITHATLAAFYLPMHTATRLAVPVIDKLRALRPDLRLAAYGLYAPLNESLLREHGVDFVLGPEAEADVVALVAGLSAGHINRPQPPLVSSLAKLQFITPDRAGLPPLAQYATLQMPDGSSRVAGATDATRGCKHRCRHCPIVPVYDGQFRVVPVDVVLADIEQQITAGAEHITFGDPDFFNGPTHARRIVETLHDRHPRVSYDVTIKIEHLLKHRDLLPVLARTGCAFITSAVESVDDEVLGKLEKGHTRADFVEACRIVADEGLALAPTFVAFTPWTTLDGYRDLLTTVAALDLAAHVAPVQWGLRLLVTQGSRLLELPDVRDLVGPFNSRTLTYPWTHPDHRVDDLQSQIAQLVGVRTGESRGAVFERVSEIAGLPVRRSLGDDGNPAIIARAAIPYLNEPWYC